MRLGLVSLLVLFWSLASAMNPAFAAGLMVFVDICAPLEIAYSTGAYPISLIALIVLAGSFGFNVAIRGYRPLITFFFVMWCVFMGWICVSAALSPFPSVAWAGVVLILKYLGPLLIVSMSMRTVADVKFLAYVLAGSLGIWGAPSVLRRC